VTDESGDRRVKVFSTCPQSRDMQRGGYRQRVCDVSRWSEAAGCEGILVYTDNGIVDPWLVAQLVVQSTERLCPLVALQPVYMHPYTAAHMVSSIAHLYERRMYLNMVAGGFRNDLISLGDETPHDERYERAVEYGQIVLALTSSPEPLTAAGRYYNVAKLRLTPPVAPELTPGMTISGSSPAGLAAAEALGAIAVKYPQPSLLENPQPDTGIESGMRVGIVARESTEEAWGVAYERFPEDRAGQIAHNLAMRTSDSQWHRELSALAHEAASADDPYWLGPFKNYKTFCPYLVGSYDRVAGELARYMGLGFETFILDIPPSEEELHHIGTVFSMARGTVAA
jgi:alkanesulfonate monooxygenase